MAPCEQRLQTELEILKQISAEDPGNFYPSVKRLALRSYWFYLRVILQYRWMDPWFHGEELVRFVEENKDDALLILLPRDSGKSGCITVPMPAYWLAKDPFTSALICNSTQDRAAKMARAAASIIENNEQYKLTFADIVPSAKWGEGGYYLDTSHVKRSTWGSVERIDAGIGCYGVGGNITGTHINGGMLLDDLINERAAKYKSDRDRAREFAKEAITCLNPGKPIICCGTRWCYDDFYGELLEGSILGPRGKFKVLKMGVTKKTPEGEVLIWPQKTFIDLQGRASAAGYTWDYIEAQKVNRKHLFSALFYNEPVTDADRAFDTQRVKQKIFTKAPFELGPVQGVFIECEAQGTALLSTMEVMMREQGRRIRVEKIHSGKAKKQERIKAWLQPIISEFKFNLAAHLFMSENNIGSELANFPRGHDDCIDATAYLSQLAQDTQEGNVPFISIVVDPAFTEGTDSDYTAIVAGCRYRGELWVLDCHRFQTDRADVLIRMIFAMYDKYNVGYLKPKHKNRTPGFSGARLQGARAGLANAPGLEIDLSGYYTNGDTQ